MKKFFASLVIFALLTQIVSPSLAVETNSQANPWTITKAEHLARKALFGATPDIVNTLYTAGSAQNAVNILFPSVSGPDRTIYNNEINTFTSQTGFSITNSDWMKKYYAFKKYRDPYEAKAKSFVMFEDIFSVDAATWNGINYPDVENTHKLIYDNMFDSNYKNLVKKIVFNGNSGGGDYSLGKYLDLFNVQYPNSPNENYARELMQLFLMLEYKPWENQDSTGAVKNYTDSDIASLARILTGLESDANTHQITFNPNKHNTGSLVFLTGALKSGDNFPFYNEASGSINSLTITNSISGNNGLTDNIIDYIFSKREGEIADFLAWRLLKYYVKDSPTQSEIQNLASIIISNGFNMFDSVKYLLASDIMYSDEAMNKVYYKNPLELTIGTFKLLHYKNPSVIDPFIYDSNLLSAFEWTPYFPGSIFGRDGFDSNSKFFNSYHHNQFVNFSTKIAYYLNKSDYYNIDDLFPIKKITETGNNINFSTSTGANLSGTLNLSNIKVSLSGAVNLGLGETTEINGISGNINFSDYTINVPLYGVSAKINSGIINISNGTLSTSGASVTYSGTTYFVNSATANLDGNSTVERDINIGEMISQFENFLYLGRKLPTSVKTEIEKYLLTDESGKSRLFLPNNIDYKNKYIRGVISIMLTQPEFVMNMGFDKSISNSSGNSQLPSSNSKLIFVELFGGYDWLHAMIQKDNYDDYVTKRGSLALAKENLIDLGDYYMNPAYTSLKPLYDSNNLRIVNRVGSTKHSRGHDTAAVQITSKYGLETAYTPSIIGNLIEQESDATKNIVLGTNSPNIYSNGNYLNIGGSDSRYTNYASNLTASGKTAQLQAIKNIMNSREFPGESSDLFKGSVTIDNVANTSKNAGGQPSSGYSLKQKFDFTKVLIDNNLGTTYYVPGGGGYDTHSDEVTSSTTDYDLTNRTTDLANELSNFFNSVKNKDVTIVVFSEFGRTLKTNGTTGTDHGQGGGMFILSSNQNLINSMPNKVIGNMNLAKEKSDWFGIGVDYRSIYNKILLSLYGISNNYLGTKYDLENDLSLVAPKVQNLNISHKNTNGTINNTIEFDIKGKNFDITNASNVVIKYGKTLESLNTTINSWETQYSSNPIVKGDKVKFTKSVSGTGFAYEIKISNSQFTEMTLTGLLSFDTTSTGAKIISPNKDTFIRNYSKNVIGEIDLVADKVLLGTTASGETLKTLTKGNGISLILGSGSTYIEKLTGSGTWNGGFNLGSFLDKNQVISDEAITSSGEYLKNLSIEKLIKIGGDTLGVGLKLDRDIAVEIENLQANTKYKLVYSEDLLNWKNMNSLVSNSQGKLTFLTNHFTFFAIIQDVPDDLIPDNFSFTSQTNKELSTIYESNSIVISGINTQIPISITGGEYSINGGSFTGSIGIVNNSDSVKLRLTSSANYSTNSQAILNIGGVTGSFSITTKSDPTIIIITPPSNGGTSSSGGRGGGGLSRDKCPSGDSSPSYYDRTCGNKINSSTGTIKNTEIKKPIIINTGFEKKYINYKGISILDIKNYRHSQDFRKQAFNIVLGKRYTTEIKKEYINRLNSLLEARFDLENNKTMSKDMLEKRYLKRKILLNSFYDKKIK